MQRQGFIVAVLSALLIANLAVLGVAVFQLTTLEERWIAQREQLRELGESNDRLRGEISRLVRAIRAGGVAAADPDGSGEEAASASREWLHPERENLLEPHDFEITLPEAYRNGRLVRHYGSDPKGFNVMIENAAELQSMVWAYVGTQLADRMAWTDPDRWYGRVAERVTANEDYTEFTITLKRGIQWHRPSGVDLGDPRYAWLRERRELTARDLAFSLEILKHPQVENGFMKNYYEDLESWEVVDDYTLVVHWKKPFYGALESTLAFPILPEFFYSRNEDGEPFPQETLGLRFNQHWYNNKGVIGTGPYRFASYEPGVEIRLERNEDYYGELPAIEELVYPIYTDPNLTLLKLKAHEEDVGGLRASHYRDEILRWQEVPPERRPQDNPFANGDIEHRKYIGMVYYYLGWNADKPLFADARVRRAMTLAFNRQGIIDHVYEGLGRVATGPFFALSPYNDPTIEPLPFDLGRAGELLAEAGFEDTDGDGLIDKDLDGDGDREEFEFTLLTYGSSPEYSTMANIFKEDLLDIGVRMNVEAVEWSLMQKRMDEKQFDAYTGGWGLGWDPDPFQLWHSSQADVPKGSNRVGFRNEEADRIIEELRRTFDKDERIRLLRRFHAILHEEQPYTFFRVPEGVFCWWDNVKRVEFAKVRPHTLSLPWWVESGA